MHEQIFHTASSRHSKRSALMLTAAQSWKKVHQWFLEHTFVPRIFTGPLTHPVVGYLIAGLLQTLAVTIMVLLNHFYPSFRFEGALFILMIMFVAFTWGAGPSIIATFIGATLLMVLLLPHFSLSFVQARDIIGVGLYLLIGLAVSVFASQKEQARSSTEKMRIQLDSIIKAIPDALVVYNQDGHIVQTNRAAHELLILDLPLQEEHRRDVGVPEARIAEEEHTLLLRVLSGDEIGEMHSVDAWMQTRDGRKVEMNTKGASIRSKEGQITGGILIYRDVTERRLLERRTLEAEREAATRASELEAAIEAMADALMTFDSVGRPLRMNTAAKHLLGYGTLSPEQFALTSHERGALFHPRDASGQPLIPEHWPITQALHGKRLVGAKTVDMQVRSLTGPELLVNISAAPIRDATGQVIGAITITRDVTARRSAERERARMLTVVAHEIKTPLTAMKLQTYVLKRQIADGMRLQTRDMEDIEYDITRIEYLINDLLDAARLDADHLAFEKARCDLVVLCQQAAREQRATSGRAVELDLTEEPVEVCADASRISQVLMNLLSNALKYSPGHTPVSLGLRQEGGMAHIGVRDVGPGIAREATRHLFEQFYRVPGIRVQHGSGVGLGLGLYICRMLIERQGGHIGVESVPGQGSTFWFTLPLADQV
jgi:PAS domain S-box-containing protein